MSELLTAFGLSYAKWNATIAACALGLWLALVGCAITSIRAQPFGKFQRRFWTCAVVLMPIFGLLAYLPFSVTRQKPSLRTWIARNRATQRQRANEKFEAVAERRE